MAPSTESLLLWEKNLSVKDSGEAAVGAFGYSSSIRILLYLIGRSRPDTVYRVNCLTRYVFCPKLPHKKIVKQLGLYLKATQRKGLILDLSSNMLKIDCYIDKDFTVMYEHESNIDPSCVKNKTGYGINIVDCPVVWVFF